MTSACIAFMLYSEQFGILLDEDVFNLLMFFTVCMFTAELVDLDHNWLWSDTGNTINIAPDLSPIYVKSLFSEIHHKTVLYPLKTSKIRVPFYN